MIFIENPGTVVHLRISKSAREASWYLLPHFLYNAAARIGTVLRMFSYLKRV